MVTRKPPRGTRRGTRPERQAGPAPFDAIGARAPTATARAERSKVAATTRALPERLAAPLLGLEREQARVAHEEQTVPVGDDRVEGALARAPDEVARARADRRR